MNFNIIKSKLKLKVENNKHRSIIKEIIQKINDNSFLNLITS